MLIYAGPLTCVQWALDEGQLDGVGDIGGVLSGSPLWQGCEHCNRVTCVGDRSCAEVEACRVRWRGEGSWFEAVAVGVGVGFAWQPDHGMRFGGGEGVLF